jgi:hypothetical protein
MYSDKSKIDYTEKIRNFQAIVDNYNEEISLNYLTKANWDESVFYNNFRKQPNFFSTTLH